MANNDNLNPTTIYEMVAELGFRKHFHFGGFEATRELIELCHIDASKSVLDVGCASGRTACYLAMNYGCKVTGIDLLPRMVERAHERAQREGVEHLVTFKVGDATALPLEDDLFDVVMGEFITGLLEDKPSAVYEYRRVGKPGGIIGLNEATWVKTPVPEGLSEYLQTTFGMQGDLLTPEGWRVVLEGCGLTDLVMTTQRIETLSNKRDDYSDLLRTFPKVLYMLITNRAFRSFLRESVSLPKDLLDYFGYGLYMGRN